MGNRMLGTVTASVQTAERMAEPPPAENQTLSVIIRFHQAERLPFLEEAIFSLAIQDWDDIETVVVLQNGTEDLRRAVVDIIASQPWPAAPRYQVLIVPVAPGVDGRSTLLNEGIARAAGRYLAFLDDDDFVYHHGYTTLINQLIIGERAVAVGGCRRANIRYERDHWYVQSKDNFFAWGRTRFDLFADNFVPIHSYVLDRSRLGSFDIHFDDACPPLEDYDFLLRLFASFDPDLSQLDVPVCEYRIRMDGSNSIAYVPDAPPEVVLKQKRAQRLIRARKKLLIQQMPAEQQRQLREVVCTSMFDDPDEHTAVEVEAGAPAPDGSAACPAVSADAAAAQPDDERRVLLQLTREVYVFFSNHPWWESQLSRLLHWAWRASGRRKKF